MWNDIYSSLDMRLMNIWISPSQKKNEFVLMNLFSDLRCTSLSCHIFSRATISFLRSPDLTPLLFFRQQLIRFVKSISYSWRTLLSKGVILEYHWGTARCGVRNIWKSWEVILKIWTFNWLMVDTSFYAILLICYFCN